MDRDITNSPASFMGRRPAGSIDDPDGIPAGFSFLPDGIYHEVAPNEPQAICSPLRVSAMFCDGAASLNGEIPSRSENMRRSLSATNHKLRGCFSRHHFDGTRVLAGSSPTPRA